MTFFYILILLLPMGAMASPAEEPPEKNVKVLDSAQSMVRAKLNFAANSLDSFFATERADDEFGRSRIRIRSRFDLRERAKSDLTNQYRINLRLPSLEEKFRYEFNSKKDDKTKDKERAERREKKKKNEGWIFNSDIGVSVAIPPKLVTRARVRRNFNSGWFTHRFSEQLTFITDESGLVEETNLDSDHSFAEDLLFRFVNYKRWQVLQKDFNTNHGPTLLHRVTDDDAISYGLTMQSVITDSIWYVNNYRLSMNYRRNLYQQWIYFDVIPGIDFPKLWSFRRTPFLSFQLELLFGH